MIKKYYKKDTYTLAIQWDGSNIYEVSQFLKKNVTECFDGSYVKVDCLLGRIGCYITVNNVGDFGLYTEQDFVENFAELNSQD